MFVFVFPALLFVVVRRGEIIGKTDEKDFSGKKNGIHTIIATVMDFVCPNGFRKHPGLTGLQFFAITTVLRRVFWTIFSRGYVSAARLNG